MATKAERDARARAHGWPSYEGYRLLGIRYEDREAIRRGLRLKPTQYPDAPIQMLRDMVYDRISKEFGVNYAEARRMWGRYQAFLRAGTENTDMTRRQMRLMTSEFNRLFRGAVQSHWDTYPNRPFAKLLAHVGMRPEEAEWEVGHTP